MTEDFERITLSHGELQFSALCAGEGPLVMLLHGFPDHARTFRLQLPALAEAGYRAVAPMMRGYETASQPADGDYTVETLVSDVLVWLDELGADHAHVVGHDFGGAVAYALAATAPERLWSMTTVAIPPPARIRKGLMTVPSQAVKSWYTVFALVPWLSDVMVDRRDWRLIRHLWRSWSPSFELPKEEWAELVRTLSAPGVKHAMLRYYRSNLAGQVTAKPTVFRVPTLAVTAAEDGCVDTRLYDVAITTEDFPAGVNVQRLAGAGHFVHMEKPNEFNRLVVDWIARNSDKGGRTHG